MKDWINGMTWVDWMSTTMTSVMIYTTLELPWCRQFLWDLLELSWETNEVPRHFVQMLCQEINLILKSRGNWRGLVQEVLLGILWTVWWRGSRWTLNTGSDAGTVLWAVHVRFHILFRRRAISSRKKREGLLGLRSVSLICFQWWLSTTWKREWLLSHTKWSQEITSQDVVHPHHQTYLGIPWTHSPLKWSFSWSIAWVSDTSLHSSPQDDCSRSRPSIWGHSHIGRGSFPDAGPEWLRVTWKFPLK